MTEFKKHTDKIATSILRGEYSDYDKNWWHYDREYNMLLKAQTEAFKLANEAAEQQDKEAIDTVVSELENRDKSSQVAYTAKDIQLFWRWAYCNGWYYGELEEMWFNDDDNERFTTEDVLKLWETTE